MWPYITNAVKSEYDSMMRMWPGKVVSSNQLDESFAPRQSVYQEPQRYPTLGSTAFGRHRNYNLRISSRTILDDDDTVTLQGWPSRGGIIILENATPPDFDFLHLDPLDPPLRRHQDQAAEDVFCQGLLRLGATWWDSIARYEFIQRLQGCDDEALQAVADDESLAPSQWESRWVRVAWPSQTSGALCVLACPKAVLGRWTDKRVRLPQYRGLISLARTMDERCRVLQQLGGTMYTSIDDYDGPTFLKAWEEGHQGERGKLVIPEFMDPASYGGHPDEALGRFHPSRSSST